MIAPTTSLKTLSVRVRDNKHAAILSRMAFEANQVWNAANAETKSRQQHSPCWP
ncbi:hypothetical protein [Thiothrix litoralis]|uniref:hypothetical protein n=1 Tax=Thiothrix litoralis TaxID=2891210 RepID=UPI001D183E7F|nr:hypothetical protein [Thiothrix litoralis]